MELLQLEVIFFFLSNIFLLGLFLFINTVLNILYIEPHVAEKACVSEEIQIIFTDLQILIIYIFIQVLFFFQIERKELCTKYIFSGHVVLCVWIKF